MRGRLAVSLSAAVLALTGCSEDEGDPPPAPPPQENPNANPPPCAELEGAPTQDLVNGCINESGSAMVASVHDCVDGRRLYVLGDRLWGYVGETVQRGTEEEADQAAAECSTGG